VAIGGLSMGGAIALYLAATEAPDAVVAMATPVRLRPLVGRLVHAIRPVVPYVPVVMRLRPRSREALRYRSSYPRIPLAATGALEALLERMRQRLPEVHAPLLVAQGGATGRSLPRARR